MEPEKSCNPYKGLFMIFMRSAVTGAPLSRAASVAEGRSRRAGARRPTGCTHTSSRHLDDAQLAHLETHYFRHRWLAELELGPVLLLAYLRSLCYHNPQTGETHDEVTLLSGELEQLFQKSAVTVRAWLARLDEALGAGHPHGPFLKTVDMQLPTQKVAATYRLNLLTPLHPDNLPRHQETLTNIGPEAGQRMTTNAQKAHGFSRGTNAIDSCQLYNVHDIVGVWSKRDGRSERQSSTTAATT